MKALKHSFDGIWYIGDYGHVPGDPDKCICTICGKTEREIKEASKVFGYEHISSFVCLSGDAAAVRDIIE